MFLVLYYFRKNILYHYIDEDCLLSKKSLSHYFYFVIIYPCTHFVHCNSSAFGFTVSDGDIDFAEIKCYFISSKKINVVIIKEISYYDKPDFKKCAKI